MPRTLAFLLCSALFGAGLAACGGDEPAWRELTSAHLDGVQKRQAAIAHEARDAMFRELSARLKAAVVAGGGAGAIAVCREEAPRVAREISERMRLRIGRTSYRLRNPDNAPPDWARALVEARAEKPRYLAHTDGRLAALLPIRTAKRCLGCHGALDAILPPVREALAQHYPDDAATGFAEGDLRGWFWLEIRAPAAH